MKGDILVLSESKEANLDAITWELLCKGRELADLWGTRLAVLLIGHDLKLFVETLQNSGADVLLTAEHPGLEHYNAELYASVIAEATKEYNPSLLLMGYTYLGMEVGPAIAVRLGGTMVTNCTALHVEDDNIFVIRPMFRGTLNSKIQLCGPTPNIISFEKGILPKPEGPSQKKARVEPVLFAFDAQDLRSDVIDILIPPAGAVDITKAKILVSAGRGIGGPDKIQMITELADVLGGAVSCSRPVADMGWLSIEHQVGISANTVSPEVYIACGISGASQHVTAMRDSGTIIAINKDANAPIFRVADYGIVGDIFDVVPEIIKEARKGS